MNHISLFLSQPAPPEAPGTSDRQPISDADQAADFAALFGSLLTTPLSSDARQLLKEFGADPRLEGALHEAGLGSEALRVLRELGIDEASPAAIKGSGELETLDGSLDDVSRELKQRVERVQDRMLAEFGHKVRVVETHRSQERQLELYAQGRTEPGPVVTWTERSAHTQGLAVDVIVDGGYDDEQAFERLQRIAREEGLKTLGPSDRGHLELDRETATASSGRIGRGVATVAAVARVASPARIATPGNMEGLAEVPRVEVPRIETPANPLTGERSPESAADLPRPPIIKVGRPDIMDVGGSGDRRESPIAAPELQIDGPATSTKPSAEVGIGRGDLAANTSGRGSDQPTERDSGREDRSMSTSPQPIEQPVSPDPIADSSTPSISGTAASNAEAAVARAQAAEGVGGADAVERVAQIRDLQLDGRAHRVSRLVLDIPDGVDSIGKLDISSRGDLINARIDANQSSLADQLRSHVIELQQGLAGRGLQPDVLQIRDAQMLDALRLAGAAGTSGGAEASTARSETGSGSSGGSGSNRDDQTGDFDRNHTNDSRSNDGRNARREDGRRDQR